VCRTVVIHEVLGLSDDYALAYYKSQEAAGSFLPNEGAVLISLSDKVNLSEQAIEIGKELKKHPRLRHASPQAACRDIRLAVFSRSSIVIKDDKC